MSSWKHRWLNWKYPCLIINDGQDLSQMKFKSIVETLFTKQLIKPLLIIGIHADQNRMQEYGTINQPDYKGRGDRAAAYANFVRIELFSYLKKHFRLKSKGGDHSIAGFSLGGLSAFDMAWHHPDIFGQVGVFSGSLWWRYEPYQKDDPDAHLIVPTYVKTAQSVPEQRYWFQAGTKDETSDRNSNGIIDAIDDTLILIQALRDRGQKDIYYREVEEGTHDPTTWGKVMPEFLQWLKT